MGTSGEAETDPGAGLFDDPDFLVFNRDGVGGTDPNTREAGDAQLGVDAKIQRELRRALGLR
jgi:hypothetical protein